MRRPLPTGSCGMTNYIRAATSMRTGVENLKLRIFVALCRACAPYAPNRHIISRLHICRVTQSASVILLRSWRLRTPAECGPYRGYKVRNGNGRADNSVMSWHPLLWHHHHPHTIYRGGDGDDRFCGGIRAHRTENIERRQFIKDDVNGLAQASGGTRRRVTWSTGSNMSRWAVRVR